MKCMITIDALGQDYSKGMARLEAMGIEAVWNSNVHNAADEDEVVRQCDGVDFVIASVEKWSEKALAACKSLKCIARYGVGFDSVDIPAATRLGVAVATIPGVNAKGVAEHAVCLMMCAARELDRVSGKLHQGVAAGRVVPQVTSGTIGVIGTGNIGKTVIRYLSGMDVTFLAYDAYPDAEFAKKYNVTYVELDELLARSDAVTIHCPLLPSTKGLINKEKLKLMKPTAILVNTSRGGMIVSEDLADALRNGVIRYAALDVFEDEGGEGVMGAAFRDLDNVVLTPHMASNTFKTLEDMLDACIDVIEAYVAGKPMRSLLNPDYAANRRA